MANIVKVGMADLNLCQAPDGITTLGLGSCVGVALREPGTIFAFPLTFLEVFDCFMK